MRPYESILFIELLGGIGDVLIALPAIQALGRSHPQAQLTVLTFAPGGELLQHNPCVHQVIYAKRGEARQSVAELLARQAFDLIVSDTNYDGIADAIQTDCAATRVVTNLWRQPPADERVGDRFLNILREEGLVTSSPSSPTEALIHLTAAEKAKASEALGAAFRPFVCLCPDAGMPIKRWSTANFITLGQALQDQYSATVIVPVGADLEQAMQIAEGIGGTRVWPRGTLRELAAVIAQADLVVAADTGPARIAAALNVPTITLFGPSWHGRYGQPAPHINLQGYPECPERVTRNFTEQRCWYSSVCPFEQWDTCLEAISPADILAAADALLKGQGARGKGQGATHRNLPPKQQTTNNKQQTTNSNWQTARNILVMRLDNIGDVIMTSPALRAIKENLPQAKLTLMASPGGALSAPLLPWVDEVLPWRSLWQDLGRLEFNPAREWELVDTLRDRHFDAAIIFTSFSQSPHPAALVCHLAGIPLRLGESKELGLGGLTHELPAAPDEIHQVERNLRLIESVGFEVSDRQLTIQVPGMGRWGDGEMGKWGGGEMGRWGDGEMGGNPESKIQNPYLLLNPWTSCQSRNYAADRFAAAARQLAELTGWSVVVTGVEKDRDRAGPLLEALGSCAVDLIGATSLPELAALIAHAQLVLTNNTSTMHIADATSTPSVILFAGTELECQWHPRHGPAKLLRRPTVCSPCYAFTCPYELQCLDIPPEAVVAAGLELLQEAR